MKKIILYIVFTISLAATAKENPTSLNQNIKTEKLKLYKKHTHASYLNDKFNGKKTASGKKFDNGKLTAAHKKFPFGTKLKITNEQNNKSVIVEVIDRGPFVNGREIDLSKKAFRNIASNKKGGTLRVTIEIVEN